MRKYLVLLGFYLFVSVAFSQEKIIANKMAASIQMGVSQFYGDIDQQAKQAGFQSRTIAYGGSFSYSFNKVFGAIVYLHKGTLAGISYDERKGQSLDLYFNADYMDVTPMFRVNMNTLFDSQSKWLSFYTQLGGGMLWHQSLAKQYSTQAIKGFAGYSSTGSRETWQKSPLYAFGFGAKMKVSQDYDLGIDYLYALSHTDALDAYVVNDTYADSYTKLFLSVIYHIGKGNHHIDFKQ